MSSVPSTGNGPNARVKDHGAITLDAHRDGRTTGMQHLTSPAKSLRSDNSSTTCQAEGLHRMRHILP